MDAPLKAITSDSGKEDANKKHDTNNMIQRVQPLGFDHFTWSKSLSLLQYVFYAPRGVAQRMAWGSGRGGLRKVGRKVGSIILDHE